MARWSRNRLDLAIVFAVAFISNFSYLYLSNGDFYYPDSFTYLAPARAMLHGEGFLNARGGIEALRTPGYPVVPAIFIGSVVWFVVNALINEPVPTLITFALILAGVPVHYIFFHQRVRFR